MSVSEVQVSEVQCERMVSEVRCERMVRYDASNLLFGVPFQSLPTTCHISARDSI